jgi:PTS system galactitol-specific IIB component
MKRVLVACGNGIATSTMVAMKIRDLLEKEKIECQVEQCKMLEIPSKADMYDLIVTTGKFEDSNVKTPIIGGIALLTGIGEEEVLEQIKNTLQ